MLLNDRMITGRWQDLLHCQCCCRIRIQIGEKCHYEDCPDRIFENWQDGGAPGFPDRNWAAVRSIMREPAEAKKLAFFKLDLNRHEFGVRTKMVQTFKSEAETAETAIRIKTVRKIIDAFFETAPEGTFRGPPQASIRVNLCQSPLLQIR